MFFYFLSYFGYDGRKEVSAIKILLTFIRNIGSFLEMVDSIRMYASGNLRSFYGLELMFGYILNFLARFLFDLLN